MTVIDQADVFLVAEWFCVVRAGAAIGENGNAASLIPRRNCNVPMLKEKKFLFRKKKEKEKANKYIVRIEIRPNRIAQVIFEQLKPANGSIRWD